MSSTTADSPAHGKTSDHETTTSGVEADEKFQSTPTPLKVEGVAPSVSPTSDNDPNIVDFDGPDDPYRPLNWLMRKKLTTTALYSLTTMGSTWASTMYYPL